MRSTCLSILAALTLLVLPLRAGADMLDVIENTLNDGCDMAKYLAIVDDFNAYYKDRGYQTEILLPLHAERQDTVVWVGRSASHAAFGEAYDHWVSELAKEGSAVSELSARFLACSTGVTRSSYSTAR